MAEAAGDIFGPINAETGDLTQFDSTVVEGTMTLTAEAGAKANGTFGFKIMGDGTNESCYGVKAFSGAVDVIYARCYIYIPAACDGAAWGAEIAMDLRDVDSSVARAGFQFNASGDPLRWIAYVGSSGSNSTTNFSVDNWHYLELYYIKQVDTGGIVLRVDGTTVVTDLNQTTTESPTKIWIGASATSQVMADDDYFYIDDVKGNSTGPIGAYSEAAGGTSIPHMMAFYRQLRVA